ncbi:hypothetical protein JCM11251_007833 [Rhodosporidiobolus azoricus]
MVRIRKKTSKRGTTRLREKVKHKVSEAKKKAKKTAKKDVTWKSNKPKEIGIPNSFPYKDQLLAEAQAEKARVEEEKAARREAAKTGASSATLASTAALAAALAADSAAREDMELDEDDEANGEKLVQDASLKLHAKSLRKVLEMSDVVVEVLDARDPVGTRCKAVERELKQLDGGRKKLVLVLNKIDLVPPQVVQAWLDHLRLQAPTIPFKSSTQQQRNHLSASSSATPQSASGSSTKPLMELIKGFRLQSSSAPSAVASGSSSASADASGKPVRTSLTIGLVGHPNVGKSSLINTLKRSKACSVAPTPGWTKDVQEVVLEKGIRVLDCPGVVVEQRGEIEGALKGMVRPEDVTDPKAPIEAILSRCKREHLQMLYSIPYFDSLTSFLLEVARAKGRLRKGGVPDLDGTARSILRDWVAGRIPYYTSPPSKEATAQLKQQVSAEAQVVGTVSEADVGGAAILTGFSAPAIDLAALFGEADAAAFEGEGGAGSALEGKRAVAVKEGAMGVESEEADVGWVTEEKADDLAMEDDEEEGGDGLDLDDLVDDDDEDDDAMEDDDEEPAPAPAPKLKTKRPAPGARSDIVSVAPPAKKGKMGKSVSFSSTPLGPTGSTKKQQQQQQQSFTSAVDEGEGAVGTNKKARKDAKKLKKKAAKREAEFEDEVRSATRQFGPDVELPSKPRAAQKVSGGAGAVGDAYDFAEYFGKGAK